MGYLIHNLSQNMDRFHGHVRKIFTWPFWGGRMMVEKFQMVSGSTPAKALTLKDNTTNCQEKIRNPINYSQHCATAQYNKLFNMLLL